MNILVTGGAGFIGSHTCVELLNRNYNVIVVDNLLNSKIEAVKRVEQITNKEIQFYNTDLLNAKDLRSIFRNEKIDSVIHFAALKAVGESVNKPLEYYDNNLGSLINLLKIMREFNVNNLIYSSSATVYGNPEIVPIKETAKTSRATNPYGTTKIVSEWILEDFYNSNKDLNITCLRYFNPIGAHESGLIGEDPNGIPNNLVPFISQVAVGKLKELSITGNDYNTPDGTGVRDYIHVVDLAVGHINALEHLNNSGFSIYNLGTGKGISVLEMVQAFEKNSGKKIPYKFVDRRPGDIATSYADPSKAFELLNFKAVKTLDDMCKDSWNWQEKNPNGYN